MLFHQTAALTDDEISVLREKCENLIKTTNILFAAYQVTFMMLCQERKYLAIMNSDKRTIVNGAKFNANYKELDEYNLRSINFIYGTMEKLTITQLISHFLTQEVISEAEYDALQRQMREIENIVEAKHFNIPSEFRSESGFSEMDKFIEELMQK